MTLGEHIQLLRKQQNLSQEDVGAILGVSRQAVSKWETDQTLPDTGNLLALAELFQVSADELAGRKQERSDSAVPLPLAAQPSSTPLRPRPSHRRTFLRWIGAILGICLLTIVILALPRSKQPHTDSSTSTESESVPDVATGSEFSLFWFDHGIQKQLSLGSQDSLWDFGQDIATYSVSEPQVTDWPGTTVMDYLCSAPETTSPSFSTFSVQVMHIDSPDDPPTRDFITHLATTAQPFTTPRGIHPGSSEGELLLAYGDALLYSFKQSGTQEELLCPHDYYYIYTEGTTQDMAFYISNYAVVGIELSDYLDGQGAVVNNTTVFPVKDGTPDFSQRVEPEREEHQDATLLVYQAFYTLCSDANLSPDDIYRYRRQLFSNLSGMDWQLYGDLTAEVSVYDDPDSHNAQAIEGTGHLLDWLIQQEALSRDELLWLQLGCQSNLDGWLTESYCSALANAFFLYPVQFTQLLADKENPAENSRIVVLHTLYGADLSPEREQFALDAISSAGLIGPEGAWADYLISCLNSPLDQRYQIFPPEEPS